MRTELKRNLDIQNKINRILDCSNIVILGPKNSGKTSVAIHYAMSELTKRKSFFFTTQNKVEVIEKALSIFPEFESHIKSKLSIYMAPNINNRHVEKIDDKMLSEIILGIIHVVEKNNPDRIVFDEITSFLSFSNLDSLKEVFQKLLKVLEYKNIPALFTVAEPVSQRSIDVINEFTYHLNLRTNPIF